MEMAARSHERDDKALAARILAGDEAAFVRLFDELFPKLYRFAMLRLDGNRDDVCEVVQQTYCRAFEQLASYRGEASLFGWMCQICRNAIADLGRERRRLVSESSAPDRDATIESFLDALSAPMEDEPESQLLRMDLIRLVQSTLDCLPARYGDVLEWKYVDGLAVNEIAVRLDLGPKATESLLTRARAAFRDAMAVIAGSREELALLREGGDHG
jgi:RNA polymerase sigma-70 factor (ECF subfamily)